MFNTVVDAILNLVNAVLPQIVEALRVVGNVITSVVDSIIGGITQLAEIISTMVIGTLEMVDRIINSIGDSITNVITAISNGITSVMTVISNTVLGVMDRIIGIINAITGGIIAVIESIKDFQNVDYEAVSKTAWAYSKLAASLGSVAITAAAAGISQFIGSIGKLGSRALDSIGDALFGKEELNDINNYYNMSFDAGDAALMGQAVAEALDGQTLDVRVSNTGDFSFGKQRG